MSDGTLQLQGNINLNRIDVRQPNSNNRQRNNQNNKNRQNNNNRQRNNGGGKRY